MSGFFIKICQLIVLGNVSRSICWRICNCILRQPRPRAFPSENGRKALGTKLILSLKGSMKTIGLLWRQERQGREQGYVYFTGVPSPFFALVSPRYFPSSIFRPRSTIWTPGTRLPSVAKGSLLCNCSDRRRGACVTPARAAAKETRGQWEAAVFAAVAAQHSLLAHVP